MNVSERTGRLGQVRVEELAVLAKDALPETMPFHIREYSPMQVLDRNSVRSDQSRFIDRASPVQAKDF